MLHSRDQSEACIPSVDHSEGLMSGFQDIHGYLCRRYIVTHIHIHRPTYSLTDQSEAWTLTIDQSQVAELASRCCWVCWGTESLTPTPPWCPLWVWTSSRWPIKGPYYWPIRGAHCNNWPITGRGENWGEQEGRDHRHQGAGGPAGACVGRLHQVRLWFRILSIPQPCQDRNISETGPYESIYCLVLKMIVFNTIAIGYLMCTEICRLGLICPTVVAVQRGYPSMWEY